MRDIWLGTVGLLLFFATFCAIVLLMFDPFGEARFLLNRDHARMIVPIARLGAAVAVCIAMPPFLVSFVRAYRHPEFRLVWPSLFPEEDGQRVVSDLTIVKFTLFFLLIGAVVFYGAFLGLREYIPYVQHIGSESRAAVERFMIQGPVNDRTCVGVIAHNPTFYSDRLCGVRLGRDGDRYYGKDIVLTGRRSPYGFRFEHYDLPDVAQPADR